MRSPDVFLGKFYQGMDIHNAFAGQNVKCKPPAEPESRYRILDGWIQLPIEQEPLWFEFVWLGIDSLGDLRYQLKEVGQRVYLVV